MTIILSKKDIIKWLKKTHQTDATNRWFTNTNIKKQSLLIYINFSGDEAESHLKEDVDDKTERLIRYAFSTTLRSGDYNFELELTKDGKYKLTPVSSLT